MKHHIQCPAKAFCYETCDYCPNKTFYDQYILKTHIETPPTLTQIFVNSWWNKPQKNKGEQEK